MNDVIVRASGIDKSYGRIRANLDVNLELARGEVHAVLGENGAGKSTLMKMLYGLETPDAGSLEVVGKPIRFLSPRDAINCGIGMVHQHFMLLPALTVLENLVLGGVHAKTVLRLKAAKTRLHELASQYRIAIDLDARVRDLSLNEQQRVEILKTLVRGAKILLLDEPTAVLTPLEVVDFMATLRELAARGFSILIVTHKISEVMKVSDRVTVMRSGRVVGTWRTTDVTESVLVDRMIGRGREKQSARTEWSSSGAPILEVADLHVIGERGEKSLRGLNLTVRAGEIVGIAGIEGTGQQEFAEALLGLRPIIGGRIAVDGKTANGASTSSILQSGVAFVPADRHRDSLILEFSIAENAVLVRHNERSFRRLGFLISNAIISFARKLIEEFGIRAAGPDVISAALSGGNQQKLVLGREIMRQPKLLVVMQPTRGLDIGAIDYVHERLITSRNTGMAIVVISSDLDELLALSDRIAVLRAGIIVDIVESSQASVPVVGHLMLGAHTHQEKIH